MHPALIACDDPRFHRSQSGLEARQRAFAASDRGVLEPAFIGKAVGPVIAERAIIDRAQQEQGGQLFQRQRNRRHVTQPFAFVVILLFGRRGGPACPGDRRSKGHHRALREIDRGMLGAGGEYDHGADVDQLRAGGYRFEADNMAFRGN